VLTLEWAPGAPLSAAETLAIPRLERPALASALVRGFLAQALDHGVFHADLHEGNLFVAPADKIMTVDFGIVGRLGAAERRYLAEILWGFLQRDYQRIADVHFEAGYVPRRHDPAIFAQALRAVGEAAVGQRASQLSMGRLLAQLFEVTALFDMALRPELILLQKTMVTVEGGARSIDPEHDIWSAAEPVVRRWIQRELSPAAGVRRFFEEGRAAIRALSRLPVETSAAANSPSGEDRLESADPWLRFALGVLTAVAAFCVGLLLR